MLNAADLGSISASFVSKIFGVTDDIDSVEAIIIELSKRILCSNLCESCFRTGEVMRLPKFVSQEVAR